MLCRLASVFYILALGFLLLVLQPYPLLHDYPEWMYQGHIFYSMVSGTNAAFRSIFELVPVPVPNALSQVGIALLNTVFTPVMAGKLWLGLYLLLVGLVGYLITGDPGSTDPGSTDPGSTDQGADESSASTAEGSAVSYGGVMQLLFTVAIAFGPGFWNGYINFQFGLVLFALFVVLGASRSLPWIFVFSLLIYFSHASVFAGFVVYIVLAEQLDQRRAGIAAALLPSLALLLWYTVSRLLEGGGVNVALDSIVEWIQYKLYTLAKQGPFHNFIQADGESLLATMHPLYMAGFGINFLVAGLIGLWGCWVLWRFIRGMSAKTKPTKKELGKKESAKTWVATNGAYKEVLGTIIVLLIAFLLAGKNSFGVVNLGERFLIVALMLMLLRVACPAPVRNLWAALCAMVSVGTLVSFYALSADAEKQYAVDRSAETAALTSYVDDIYKNSRHKYFNHRLFIYADLGQYLSENSVTSDQYPTPPMFDHQSSVVRIKNGSLADTK